MKSIILTAAFLILSPIILIAQSHQIRGKVTDKLTGEGLQYVNVYIEQLSRGTVTDEKGSFLLVIPDGQYKITFGHIGYKSETADVGRQDTILNILMIPVSHFLNEVNIYSNKDSKGKVSSDELQSRQIEEYAGITKDALRSVQLLPGVSTNNEATANFNVRGGSYDENLVLINGVHINEPFHLKQIENASVGIFNIDMAKKVDFSAGGFDAENGDALSSILKVDYREGNSDKFSAKMNLSMVDLGIITEGYVDQNSTFILGARRSYLNQVLKLAGVKGDYDVYYHDIQGVYSYHLTNKNKLKLTFIYSGDKFAEAPESEQQNYTYRSRINAEIVNAAQNNTSSETIDGTYSNLFFSMSSINLLSPSVSNSIIVSFYNEKNDFLAASKANQLVTFENRPEYVYQFNDYKNFLDSRSNNTVTLQTSFDFLLTNFNTLSAGVNYERINYSMNKHNSRDEKLITDVWTFPDTVRLDYPVDPVYSISLHLNTPVNKYAGYVQDRLQLSDNIFLTAGLRGDYFDLNKSFVLSPRANFSYVTTWGTTLKCAYGIFYQSPNYKQLKYDYATKENTKFQKAEHYILGLEQKFSGNLNIKLEGYYKKYDDLIPVRLLMDGSLDYGNKDNAAEGYATGFDIQFLSDFDWINLRLSYGFLVSKEKLKGTDEYYSRYTDQTHTLTGVIDLNLGKKWSLSLREFYGSGYAYPPSYLDNSVKPAVWKTDTYNTIHLPAYEREDLRISKEFSLFEQPLVIYLDIMNLFNNKNLISVQYRYDGAGNPRTDDIDLFPMVPSLGMTYSF